MSAGDAAAWLAAALLPGTAATGWFLRRWGSGSFIARMRPHFILGYAVLGLALAHVALSMGNAAGANGAGIWCASFAMAGIGLQTFSGTNLQSPGAYRLVLRRWHVALFWTIAVLGVGHIALNG